MMHRVLVNGITGSLGEAEDCIGRIAKLVVDRFDRPPALVFHFNPLMAVRSR
jgi:hypothetical protein